MNVPRYRTSYEPPRSSHAPSLLSALRRQLPKRLSVSAKITLVMIGLIIAAISGVTLLSIQREQTNFRSELQQQAALLIDVLESSTVDSLYLLDVDALTQIAQDLAATEQGISGRLYDADGRILADSARSAAPVFELDADPYGTRLLASAEIVFDWQRDQLVAGRAVMVGRTTVGALSVTLPTQGLMVKMNQVRDEGVFVALIAVAVGALLAFALSRLITEPLRQFTAASTRITRGDYSGVVRVETRDELRDVANAFNTMTAHLRELVQRLEQRAADLQTANERAQETSRLKSEFLATMSHELRTPLNAIIGFSDMLLMGMSGPLNERQQHKITRLQENGKRLLHLVNDILDIARIEAGRVEVQHQPFSPHQLIDRLSAQMRPLADAKQLQFETHIDSALPLTLIGDEKHIEQVVVNLLSNAFKFTEHGTVTLKLESQAEAWAVRVIDTGVGIPPHALDLIFEEFRQVDGSSNRAYKGSGLGLAITRHLVRVMDGKVNVESVLGSGSTFTVTLPLTLPAEEKKHVLTAELELS